MAAPVGSLDATVVLCGGASRRMGRDKAALELGGSTLLERAVAIAAASAPRVLLATGVEPRYAELGRETVQDAFPDGGPLAGIEAALARVAEDAPIDAGPGAWLGVLACDMPRAAAEVLARCAARGAERDLDVVLFETEAGLEPLLSAVHTRALPAVRAALARGERRVTAFHADVRVGTVRLAELPAELAARRPERNLNTPQELRDEMSPELRDESPELRDESPELRDESPELRDESPELRDESPELCDESPELRDESPELRDELSPELRDESMDPRRPQEKDAR